MSRTLFVPPVRCWPRSGSIRAGPRPARAGVAGPQLADPDPDPDPNTDADTEPDTAADHARGAGSSRS